MRRKTVDWKAYAALLAVYLIWGTTAGTIKLGVDSFPSAFLPFARFFMAGLLMCGLAFLKGEAFPPLKEWRHHLIIGFLLFFAGNSLIAWTVKYVSTGFGSVLVASTPLWMNLLSAVLPPREKLNPLALTGISIGFFGMLILLSPKLLSPVPQNEIFWWCIAGLATMTFCWALGSIYARKHPVKSSLMMSIGLQNLMAALMLLPVCWLQIPDWHAIQPTWTSMLALLYLVFFGTMIATPCYYYVLKHFPVSVSSTFAYVTPVLATAFGYFFLGESISPTMILGASVIFVGVALVQWIHQRQLNHPSVNAALAPACIPLTTTQDATIGPGATSP